MNSALMAATLSISDRNPATGPTWWRERVKAVTENLAVRHGIKFGLAGTLSVFVALLVRLPEPAWALITVFVVMLAQFVGAVAEKSVMRVIGTIAGGVIGYLLTAGLEQQPVLYLLLVGSVVGFGTAMFGYTKYPYAFLLCALTTMVVASNGMNNPAFSWQPALWRIVEVCVGVIVAVLVSSLLWPRYARKEFMEKMQLALEELRKGLASRSALLFGAPEAISIDERNFSTAIAQLQNLLRFGAMESKYFRSRLPTYTEIISCLSRMASAIDTLVQSLPKEAPFRLHLRAELEKAHAAIADCIGVFADAEADSSGRAAAIIAMKESSAQWREKLHALRQTDLPQSIPVEQVLHFSGHALSLEEIVEQLEQARCSHRLPSYEPPPAFPRGIDSSVSPT
jgi:uncharacterized membrane protein YccC